jgi:hypothetical protein
MLQENFSLNLSTQILIVLEKFSLNLFTVLLMLQEHISLSEITCISLCSEKSSPQLSLFTAGRSRKLQPLQVGTYIRTFSTVTFCLLILCMLPQKRFNFHL